MYRRQARIRKSQIRKLIRFFTEDINVTKTVRLVGVNRNTVNKYFNEFRERIVIYQEEEQGKMSGEIELYESYFGGPRKKKHAIDRKKRGRGVENKVPVFGIKKREDGKVYTQIIKNASKQELLSIIRRLVAKNKTTIYTNKWKLYDGLVLNGYKHKRINHSKTYSNRKGTHVNGY